MHHRTSHGHLAQVSSRAIRDHHISPGSKVEVHDSIKWRVWDSVPQIGRHQASEILP